MDCDDGATDLDVYQHTQGSLSVSPENFVALHRLGSKTYSMDLVAAENPSNLKK
jgi:hypothetical protein